MTAAAPNSTATSVTRVRPGRAAGAANPRVTGRGTDVSFARIRCAKNPCRGLGARPVAIACTADMEPALDAGPAAASTVSAITASGTTTSTQNGTPSTPTWYTCAFCR